VLSQDCATTLASDDDSGPGVFSQVVNFPAPYTGIYVVRVRHLSATGTGPYQLHISCNPTAPPNSTCDGAIVIPCGLFADEGSTHCAGNDLNLPADPGASCTGFSSNGQDVVYSVTVPLGAVLTADYANEADGSIYILQNCSDVASCLAGSDALLAGSHETLTFTFPADGTYYLVLDTFGTGSAGHFTLAVNLACEGVPVQPTTWGLIKARFVDN
jgi:hypothetical protein